MKESLIIIGFLSVLYIICAIVKVIATGDLSLKRSNKDDIKTDDFEYLINNIPKLTYEQLRTLSSMLHNKLNDLDTKKRTSDLSEAEVDEYLDLKDNVFALDNLIRQKDAIRASFPKPSEEEIRARDKQKNDRLVNDRLSSIESTLDQLSKRKSLGELMAGDGIDMMRASLILKTFKNDIR